jgi:hypothetical protein
MGVLGTVNGIGDLVVSAVMGLLWAGVSPVAGFAFAGLMMVIGAGVLSAIRAPAAVTGK